MLEWKGVAAERESGRGKEEAYFVLRAAPPT